MQQQLVSTAQWMARTPMTQNTQVSTPQVNCVLTPSQQQVVASPMEQLPSGKIKQKGQLICFRCQTPGHVAKNCTRATAEQSTASAKSRKDSSLRVVTSSTLEGSYVYLPATLHKMNRAEFSRNMTIERIDAIIFDPRSIADSMSNLCEMHLLKWTELEAIAATKT
jgi:hypothetical protein